MTFCDEHARQLAAVKDDPWLLGHLTDNELPWSRDMLEGYLSLPDGDPGHEAAWRWLRERKGPKATVKGIGAADRDSNKGVVSNRYAEYAPLLESMREVNRRTHGLIRHFDAASRGTTKR